MTGILDEPALPWDDERVNDLHAALILAYSDPDGIKELVGQVDASLIHGIDWRNPRGVRAIWRRLMDDAARARVLRELLGAALADPAVRGHHGEIRTIMNKLDGGGQPPPGEEEIGALAERASITGLAAIIAADLLKFAGQLVEQVQQLASSRDDLDAALTAADAATTLGCIRKALNRIDEIGLGSGAETPANDRDKGLRKEIGRQLEVSGRLVPRIAARPDDTTSVTGLTVAAGRLRASARRLADLRGRQHRSQ